MIAIKHDLSPVSSFLNSCWCQHSLCPINDNRSCSLSNVVGHGQVWSGDFKTLNTLHYSILYILDLPSAFYSIPRHFVILFSKLYHVRPVNQSDILRAEAKDIPKIFQVSRQLMKINCIVQVILLLKSLSAFHRKGHLLIVFCLFWFDHLILIWSSLQKFPSFPWELATL